MCGGVGLLLPDLLMTLRLSGRGYMGASVWSPPCLNALKPPVIPLAVQKVVNGSSGRRQLLRWLLCNEVGHLPASAAALFRCLVFKLQGPRWPPQPPFLPATHGAESPSLQAGGAICGAQLPRMEDIVEGGLCN